MNESISVMTDAGELVATPFAGGISVDINLPDGKSSGQLAFIEAAPEGLRDDYPTPVHVFTYDGRDSEPVHRTDVHLSLIHIYAVTKMDDIFYPSIYSLPDSGDLIGSCIDALYDPYIPEVEEAMKDVRERRKNPMARYGSTPLDAVNVTVTPALIFFKNDPSVSQRVYFCDKCSSDLNIGEKIFSCGYTADELRGMIGKKTDENFVVVAVDGPFKVRATYLNLTQKIPSPAEIAASAKKAAGAKVSAGVDGGGKRI